MGLPAFEDRLMKCSPKLEYTLQYRKSDAVFTKRLKGRLAINYHFVRSASGHALAMTSSEESHDAVPGAKQRLIWLEPAHIGEDEHFC